MSFNFNLDFIKVIKENLPPALHKPFRLNRIYAMLKPLKVLYAEFIAAKDEFVYKCRFNGTVQYLETALNDRFDSVNRDIYISDAFYDAIYIYKKLELKTPIILYKKWQSTINFPIGKFCYYQGKIYVANTTNINKVPGVASEWTIDPTRQAPILRKKANFNGTASFIVNVPITLVYSDPEMRKLIDYYRLAGFGYQITTY